MSDRHIRRGGSEYTQALLNLLPQGQAWPRDPETTLVKALTGLAEIWGFVDSRAADLLEIESDPRTTTELLADWERNWGLPDECWPEGAGTAEARRQMLMMKMTMLGGQSAAFFYNIADIFGYSIAIKEYSPFMAGLSQAGDTRDQTGQFRWEIGPPEIRYCWSLHAGNEVLHWFRAGSGHAGIDPHCDIGKSGFVECIFELWKPAHSVIVYDYSGVDNSNYMNELYNPASKAIMENG